MKRSRHYSSFENSTRRRRISIPILPILIPILLIAFLWFIWSRGGEQPMKTVEKPIATEKLGK